MPSPLPLNPVFVFIDESGNFDFSEKGTRHFVMAAVITQDPISSSGVFQKLRYRLLSEGLDIPHFHASEDNQKVRNQFLAELKHAKGVSVLVFAVRKSDLPKENQNAVSVFAMLGNTLVRQLAMHLSAIDFNQILLIFDGALHGKQQHAFLSKLKGALNQTEADYKVYFQNVKYDLNGQMADYVAWAHYVSLERNELRPLNALPKSFRHRNQIK